jgi:hypothetical protein
MKQNRNAPLSPAPGSRIHARQTLIEACVGSGRRHGEAVLRTDAKHGSATTPQ